jgi:hypothetical protein
MSEIQSYPCRETLHFSHSDENVSAATVMPHTRSPFKKRGLVLARLEPRGPIRKSARRKHLEKAGQRLDQAC